MSGQSLYWNWAKVSNLKMSSAKCQPFCHHSIVLFNVLSSVHFLLGPVSLTIFCSQFKFNGNIVPLLARRSQQNFALVTTARLSWHAQSFVAIIVSESRWEWKKNFHRIWIAMEKPLMKGAQICFSWLKPVLQTLGWGPFRNVPSMSKESLYRPIIILMA